MAGSDGIGGPVLGTREILIALGGAVACEAAFGGVHGQLAARTIAGVGEVAEVGAHDADGDVGMQILVIARAASGKEVRHVRWSIGARVLLHLHDEFILLALESFKPFPVHFHPAIGAEEEIADVIGSAFYDTALAAG